MIDRSHPDVIETTKRQQVAAYPLTSAWVSANAGSGKTYVLTRRVIRLLIGQEQGMPPTDPSRIVCITYTKAAAAEMEKRLFDQLGEWALADDNTLQAAMTDLHVPEQTPEQLAKIRQLFAQALETPGGLKIQTIHSFCEQILRRFPAEAGILPGFTVMEDAEAMALRRQILDRLATRALRGDECLVQDFDIILNGLGKEEDRDKALMLLLQQSSEIEKAILKEGGEEAYTVHLRQSYGVPEAGTISDWRRTALDKLNRADLKKLTSAKSRLPDKYAQKAASFVPLLEGQNDPDTNFTLIADEWLNAGWKRPASKTLGGNKDVRAVIPDFQDIASRIVEALMPVVESEWGAERFELTMALYRLSRRVHEAMEKEKARRGWLDFGDLIARTARLMRDTSSAWVLYKLDQGIDHILLDEAQDTGQLQWDVVEQFRDEFIAQLAAADRPRTLFVVGDKKQSIYSFQGADAELFTAKRSDMGKAYPDELFKDVNLFMSFRSAQTILDVVDHLFDGEAGQGVHDGDVMAHKAAKTRTYGRVEFWPPIPKDEVTDGDIWDLPVDDPGPNDPHRELAQRITATIRNWLDRPETEQVKGRPVRPGDILILCQRRAAQFHEIIRALSLAKIPTAGADRINLKDDVAVKDLHALLRFATNSEDHLSLAEALRSPLWGLSENELFQLAHYRGPKTLWTATREAAKVDTDLGRKCQQAVQEIETAIRIGQQKGPFAFLTQLLDQGQPNGRYRFRTRLGSSSDEAIEELLSEALDFELSHPRTLQGFLQHLNTLKSDVKKENGAESNTVRVMTVHGAKGLEAPIVFLADCAYKQQAKADVLFPLCDPSSDGTPLPRPGYLIAGVSGKERDNAAVNLSRTHALDLQMREYRRKLYVAATRAEERLYFCGVTTGRTGKIIKDPLAENPLEASWHTLAQQAFARMDSVKEASCDWSDDPILIMEGGTRIESVTKAGTSKKKQTPSAPDWLWTPPVEEQAEIIAFPSVALSEADGPDQGPVFAPRRRGKEAVDPRTRGRILHMLLQYLPDLSAADRPEAATRLLDRHAAALDVTAKADWRDEVLRVLDDRQFAALFTPDARAEVALQGQVDGQRYSGQVDRLKVTEDQILFVDYKAHRPPPTDPDQISAGIRQQMRIYYQLLSQIYPGRRVRGAVLWTHIPLLTELPEAMLMGD